MTEQLSNNVLSSADAIAAESLELISLFCELLDPSHRRQVIEFARAVAAAQAADPQ